MGTKGYMTEEEYLDRLTRATLEAYPEVDAKELKEQAHHSWIHDLNCGMHPPPGYRLTEEQFVINMWLSVNQPSFKARISEMTTKVMQQLDKEKKGYVTKDHVQRMMMTSKLHKEDDMQKLHSELDVKKDGKITHQAIERMYTFFFTDTEDEAHPFNLLRGPLVD